MSTLSKEWIKERKEFLSKEYIKVADDVSELKDKLTETEDNLNHSNNEIFDLDSLKGTSL